LKSFWARISSKLLSLITGEESLIYLASSAFG
jgi:hypothetical protein